jgi:ribulose-5-phosphate 4-epimerase/fuculose-1-phosphate aldolase
MATVAKTNFRRSVRDRVPAEEWDLRVNLAAAYRIAADKGWDDQLATHISVRLPGPKHHFLINPLGLFFEEITASSLVKIDLEGNPLEETEWGVNRAGFIIHSAIHRSRENAQCVFHLHTTAGVAVSAQADGLLPLNPYALALIGRTGYHDFEGITVNEGEQPHIVAALGDNDALILRNHGTLTVGATIAQALHRMYMLEQACAIQIAAQSGGRQLVTPPEEVVVLVQSQLKGGFSSSDGLAFAALLRRLDRIDPSYRD